MRAPYNTDDREFRGVKITGLKRSKRAPETVLVHVDGARFASLPIEVVEALGLREGLELAGEEQKRFEEAVQREGAYQKALRLLAARPRASWELLQRLRAKGFNPSIAAEAVGRLEEAGLLDDVAFAQHYARSRSEKGHGPSRILSDLLSRGVSREVAERAIMEAGVEEDDLLARAEELARKRARQLGDLPERVKVRRIVGFLARRGHGGGAVVEMVRRVVGEELGERLARGTHRARGRAWNDVFGEI